MNQFEKIRKANVERCEKSFHQCSDWSLTDWACAMAGEAGEVCNEIKKIRRGDKSVEVSKEDVGKELADVILYCDFLANALGIDLAEAIQNKFNEVSQRVNSPIQLNLLDT